MDIPFAAFLIVVTICSTILLLFLIISITEVVKFKAGMKNTFKNIDPSDFIKGQ